MVYRKNSRKLNTKSKKKSSKNKRSKLKKSINIYSRRRYASSCLSHNRSQYKKIGGVDLKMKKIMESLIIESYTLGTDHKFCMVNKKTCYLFSIFCLFWDIIDLRNQILLFSPDAEIIDECKDGDIKMDLTFDVNKEKINDMKFEPFLIENMKYNTLLLQALKVIFIRIIKYKELSPINISEIRSNLFEFAKSKCTTTFYNIFTALSDIQTCKGSSSSDGACCSLYLYDIIERICCFKFYKDFFENYFINTIQTGSTPLKIIIPLIVKSEEDIMEDLINSVIKNDIVFKHTNKYILFYLSNKIKSENKTLNKNLIQVTKIKISDYTFYLKGYIVEITFNDDDDVITNHIFYVRYSSTINPEPITIMDDAYDEINHTCHVDYNNHYMNDLENKIPYGTIFLYERR